MEENENYSYIPLRFEVSEATTMEVINKGTMYVPRYFVYSINKIVDLLDKLDQKTECKYLHSLTSESRQKVKELSKILLN